METFDPSLPLGAKLKPPKGCTCGKTMCKLHFCAEDYLPGAQVAFNPYTLYRYDGHPHFKTDQVFTINKPYWGHNENGDAILYLDLHPGGGGWHVGWFRPWGFLIHVRRALKEHDGR